MNQSAARSPWTGVTVARADWPVRSHVIRRPQRPLWSGRKRPLSHHTCVIAAAFHQLCTALLLRPGREHARGDSARDINFFLPRLHDLLSAAREYYAVRRPKINARTTAGRSDRWDSLSGVSGKRETEKSERKLNGAVDRSKSRCRRRSRKRARKVSGIVDARRRARLAYVPSSE